MFTQENPSAGKDSLYYYYHIFGKALDAYGEPKLTAPDGSEHAWYDELVRKVVSLQHADGYWENTSGRYMENLRELATAHAIIALETGYAEP